MKYFYLRIMNYKYRVTLEGIKGFHRLYAVPSGISLYTFHKQLRADLEFPADQPILFKAFDAEGNVVARYALIDLGQGAVDDIFVGDTLKNGIVKFVYFYDTVSRKSVTITLEGEFGEQVSEAVIIDSKGPLPIDFENGYVAFEDLPPEKRHMPGEKKGDVDEDDDDFEDDEDPEDKEEDELVVDESEL